jgi:hypothetical protein
MLTMSGLFAAIGKDVVSERTPEKLRHSGAEGVTAW